MADPITERSLALFLAYAKDAPNWSGTPLVGGNVGGGSLEERRRNRGNLTQLKQAGLIETWTDNGTWIEFTDAGHALAAAHDVIIDPERPRNWAAEFVARAAIEHPHVTLSVELSSDGKRATLSRIAVPDREYTGRGLADAALTDLCKAVDAAGITLTLTPTNDWGASVGRLRTWYRRHGFVNNKGSARDFEIRDDMYRLPKSEG